MRATIHEAEADCKCRGLRCFQVISEEEGKRILRQFHKLQDHNEQNKYLSGLITVLPIMRRRSRAESSHSEENYASYSYKDRAFKSGQLQDVEVCIKVFLFQGITSARVQHLREALASQGQISLDGRGKHKNRSLKLSCVYFYLCLANQRFAITH